MRDLPIAGFGVDSFRTLRNVRVRPTGPLTVLCGPNNSGKSSFLTALRDFSTVAHAVRGTSSRSGRKADEEAIADDTTAAVAIDFASPRLKQAVEEVHDVAPETLQSFVASLGDDLLWVEVKRSKGTWKAQYDQPVAEVTDAFNLLPSSLQQRFRRHLVSGLAQSTSLDSKWIQAVARLALDTPSVRVIADVRRTADEPLSHDDLLRLVQASGRRPGSRRRIQDWAQTLESILRDVFGEEVRYEVRLRDTSGDFRLYIDGEDDRELNSVGAGVREVVAIAYAALQQGDQDGRVLAIEEPENCLHPIAIKRLVNSLPSRTGVQLFVSTTRLRLSTRTRTPWSTSTVRTPRRQHDRCRTSRTGTRPSGASATPPRIWC